jgi:hypothetical protein
MNWFLKFSEIVLSIWKIILGYGIDDKGKIDSKLLFEVGHLVWIKACPIVHPM